MNKNWKHFDRLKEKCYLNVIGAEKEASCWTQAFERLKEIILEERKANPEFAPELEQIDDATDFALDIQDWLEDCLDEIDMREDYETLLAMCNDLLDLFSWPEYTDSDINFRKAIVLQNLGRTADAVTFCEQWLDKEPMNIVAATAKVYALLSAKEYNEAGKLVDRFIPDKSECDDDNEIMFAAASKLYEFTGNKKAKKEVDTAIDKYDKMLEEYFSDPDYDFDDEDDLPFN